MGKNRGRNTQWYREGDQFKVGDWIQWAIIGGRVFHGRITQFQRGTGDHNRGQVDELQVYVVETGKTCQIHAHRVKLLTEAEVQLIQATRGI